MDLSVSKGRTNSRTMSCWVDRKHKAKTYSFVVFILCYDMHNHIHPATEGRKKMYIMEANRSKIMAWLGISLISAHDFHFE